MAVERPFSDIYGYFGPSIAITGDMAIDEILELIEEALRAADARAQQLANGDASVEHDLTGLE